MATLRDSSGAFRKLRAPEVEENEILDVIGAVMMKNLADMFANSKLERYLIEKASNPIAPFIYGFENSPMTVFIRFELTGHINKISLIHENSKVKYAINVH